MGGIPERAGKGRRARELLEQLVESHHSHDARQGLFVCVSIVASREIPAG